jgi:hypothetical protein
VPTAELANGGKQMKNVRVLRNTGANLPRFTEGQVVDVEDETAELLCGLNLAELLKAIPDEPLRAIPENPSIMAAETSEAPSASSKHHRSKMKPESKE